MPAGGPLRWVFELIDKMSKPARTVDDALTRVERSLKRADGATNRLSQQMKSAAGSSSSFKKGLSALELDSFTNLMGKGWGLVKGIGEAFGDTVIKSLAFKESTLASWEMLLGSKAAAQDLFKEAAQLAKVTPFGTQDVVDSYAQLLSAGFKRNEVGVLFQGLSDISSLSDFDPAGIKAITTQLAQMKGFGKVQMQDLRPILSVSSKAGIGMEAIYGQLAQDMGTSPTAVAAMEQSGEISADQFIFSFMKAIAKKGGGKLGSITQVQSKSLKGLWSNIQAIPTDIVFGFANNLKGVDVLKGALQTVINLFDNATPLGKRFQTVMENITDSLLQGIFGDLAGERGQLALEEKMKSFLTWAESVDWKGTFQGLVDVLKDIATTAGAVASVVGPLLRFGHGVVKGAAEVAAEVAGGLQPTEAMLYEQAVKNGRAMRAGLNAGITADQVYTDAVRLADMMRAGFAGPEGIDAHSPSRVFEDLGRYSAEGYARGFAGSSDIGATLGQLVAGKVEGGNSGGRGGVVHIHEGAFPISVQGGGDADETARQLRPALLREIIALFESLGMEVGVEGAAT